ncbi:MAG TPA: ABC transporter ATP-binding protein [Dehalococcoidia bacterium]|jgi:lipooligosaccharide transport system ATP-binding protein|nr:ABC transporter ATP-binding protein [Dehalococcoidia bacterium]
MPDEIIVARDLTKRYGDFVAVDGISFDVRAGECFGFLGPNGAGKTTTIRMISCVSPITEGSLTVDGLHVQVEPRRIKARLGVVPQDDNLDPDLTVRQNLRAYARYFDLPDDIAKRRIDEILTLLQLSEKEKDRIDSLSGGLKRRLTIARGLLNSPVILILDEPTVGLDPQARHLVWQKLRSLKAGGITMLLTTHYMDEATHLCDRIVVLDHGKIIAQGTPDELVEAHAGKEVVELHGPIEDRLALMARLDGTADVSVEEVADILYVYVRGDNGFDASSLKLEANRVVYRHANLEDVFLRLTGRGLAEE